MRWIGLGEQRKGALMQEAGLEKSGTVTLQAGISMGLNVSEIWLSKPEVSTGTLGPGVQDVSIRGHREGRATTSCWLSEPRRLQVCWVRYVVRWCWRLWVESRVLGKINCENRSEQGKGERSPAQQHFTFYHHVRLPSPNREAWFSEHSLYICKIRIIIISIFGVIEDKKRYTLAGPVTAIQARAMGSLGTRCLR